MKLKLTVIAVMLTFFSSVKAQDVALKTNLLDDGFLNPFFCFELVI